MSSFRTINICRDEIEPQSSQDRLRSLNVAPPPPAKARDDEAGEDGKPQPQTIGVEAASRAALQLYLEDSGSEAMVALTSPDHPGQVPDMRLRHAGVTPDLNASTVSFQQTAASIPVFGARVTVDVDAAKRSFLAINGQLADQPDIDPIADLSPRQAAERLAEWANTTVGADWLTSAPVLKWYQDGETERWHLAYHFPTLPVTPPKPAASDPLPAFSCLNCAAVPGERRYSYLVDAHDGAILYYYSVGPRHALPVKCQAPDDLGEPRDFFCEHRHAELVLCDPVRNIETYDFAGGDLSGSPAPTFPASPVKGPFRGPEVSAHYNARLVFDFFNDVLKRDGIDDRGMKLVSVVNVSNSRDNSDHPVWCNAAWYQGRMWYGTSALGTDGGHGPSLARHLDIIGHELTHGVTETSSNLIYRDLPGALNESFSDIFGVMIANWWRAGPQSVANWNWTIGQGLGPHGGPLRDLSDPVSTGQPVHMDQYRWLPDDHDHGGVHIYSGIHNKAAHLLLTATGPDGEPSFPASEAALLLYLTLVRLTPISDFRAARRTLENVTSLYHAAAAPGVKEQRLAAIDAAYSAVGIV